MKSSTYSTTLPLEAYTRTLIEARLQSLGYEMDEIKETCNVYRERAKYTWQEVLLHDKRPDFLIYKSGSDEILAVIEAKRPNIPLEKAVEQAISLYAQPLDIPIVFVFNANSFFACTANRQPIKIDNIEINDFVDEATLLQLIKNNFSIETIPAGFTNSRNDLLKKFKKSNNLLRKAGLRDGYERFSVFADLMFLKLKDDFDDIGELPDGDRSLDKACNWRKLFEKTPKAIGSRFKIEDSEVKSYLEDTIKPKLKKAYGDVFESSLNIENEWNLIELIEEIDSIEFKHVDTDVKGDAFEFFLRNVTNGNKDLGEYYTPRHIVKMIIKLLNPIYGEKIYDPCCGTGGFLLECFKHLRSHTDVDINADDSEEVKKTKKEKRRVIREESIYGRELTSTARIAKMNMILFGDGHTHIRQMDCLSEPVTEAYDIVVSNIPYSQKVESYLGYEYVTTNGDSLFMQHIWKAVKKGGRIAVVIPDTFLYSDDASVAFIRKKIVDESSRLVVVSLPRGVFNPYTPTKTSVLIATKQKNASDILKEISMYVIRNDGFELGARRRPLSGQSDCNTFLMNYNDDKELRTVEVPDSCDVPFASVKSQDYNLFPFTYMEHLPKAAKVSKVVPLGMYITEKNEKFDLDSFENIDEECIILSVTQNGIYVGEYLSASELNERKQMYKRVSAGDFTYNPHRINVGSIGIVPDFGKNMYVSNIYPVFCLNPDCSIPDYYVLKLLKNAEYRTIINDYCLGGARADLKLDWLRKIKIKLPEVGEAESIKRMSIKLNEAYQNYLNLYKQIMR